MRLLPQDRRVFPRLTANEHIVLSKQQFGEDSRGLSVDPSPIQTLWASGRPVESASGGEAKLLLLHALLTTKPKLLLLDEPFAHLDAQKSEHILRFIQEAHRQEMAIVLADHTGYAIDGLPFAQRFIIHNHILVPE
jgi:ABC-type multidrug transport system ATPase subunit